MFGECLEMSGAVDRRCGIVYRTEYPPVFYLQEERTSSIGSQPHFVAVGQTTETGALRCEALKERHVALLDCFVVQSHARTLTG